MKGYLIYRKEEALRNQAFIRLFCEEGKALGMRFQYVSHKEYPERELPDFVLNRTRDAAVSQWYEKQHIPVFHSSFLTEIGNHKMKTLLYLEKNLPDKILSQKWAPATHMLTRERLLYWMEAAISQKYEAFGEAHAFWKEKGCCILKSVDGHGGSEVVQLIDPNQSIGEKKQDAWERLYRTLLLLQNKDCILQERIDSASQDIRVYILGNQIYQAVLRQGKQDFRSNFSLGGSAQPYTLSEKEREYVEQFLAAFQKEKLGLAGIDFILDRRGNLIFNELEEMVGCRMLYQKCRCNVVRDYIIWLKKFMENNSCQ